MDELLFTNLQMAKGNFLLKERRARRMSGFYCGVPANR
jgi:hypothetical protein